MTIYLTLVKTYTLTDKITSFGMWLWAILRNKPTKKTYGHCEVRYNDCTIGATREDVKPMPWEKYKQLHPEADFLCYPFELNKDQEVLFYKYIESAKDMTYEYMSFWFQFLKIITGRWYGSKSDKQVNCIEFGARPLRDILNYDVDIFMNPYELHDWLENNK